MENKWKILVLMKANCIYVCHVGNELTLDLTGKYLPTNKLSTAWFSVVAVMVIVVIGAGLAVAYVATKKKRWFW
jgi:hypothetical protein